MVCNLFSPTIATTNPPTEKNEVCDASDSGKGVKMEYKATESLVHEVDVDFSNPENKKPVFSNPLFEFSQPLGEECFPSDTDLGGGGSTEEGQGEEEDQG